MSCKVTYVPIFTNEMQKTKCCIYFDGNPRFEEVPVCYLASALSYGNSKREILEIPYQQYFIYDMVEKYKKENKDACITKNEAVLLGIPIAEEDEKSIMQNEILSIFNNEMKSTSRYYSDSTFDSRWWGKRTFCVKSNNIDVDDIEKINNYVKLITEQRYFKSALLFKDDIWYLHPWATILNPKVFINTGKGKWYLNGGN